MTVASWNSIGQNQRVKIMTVDPASRKVEAATKDGAMIQIAVWGQPTVFRWPMVGEIWIVSRMSGYWILVEPVQKDMEEDAPLEGLNPGDVNVTTGEGGQFLINGQPIGGGGLTPSWATAQAQASVRLGTFQQWAIPSNVDQTAHFFPLVLTQKVDGGDDGTGWTLVTQDVASIPGAGVRGNILVPPAAEEGAFLCGLRAGGFFPQLTSNGTTANLAVPDGDWVFSVGIAIYAHSGGSWFQETAILDRVNAKTVGGGIDVIPSGAPSGMAPAVNRGGTTATNEAGFAGIIIIEKRPAAVTDLTQVRFNIAFGYGGANVWASKVGDPDPNA